MIMTTIKPEDVSSRENSLYAKIQQANRKHTFLEWDEIEVMRDMIRERIDLKAKLHKYENIMQDNGVAITKRNKQIKALKGGLKLHNDYLESSDRLAEFNSFINR